MDSHDNIFVNGFARDDDFPVTKGCYDGMMYVEELKPGSNKDIGSKAYFEMACIF